MSKKSLGTIEWVLHQIEKSRGRKSKKRYKKNWKQSDSLLYKCNRCGSVWEHTKKSNRNRKMKTYQDFPTYGLARKVCLSCLEKKKNI